MDIRQEPGKASDYEHKSLIYKDFYELAERVETDLDAYLIELKDFPYPLFTSDIRSDIRICRALGGFPQPSPDERPSNLRRQPMA
jgi:hypothetical protein